jgi:NAD(P)-dependent dehydrogenase (short-subunit alcohol dehydrogenase family)
MLLAEGASVGLFDVIPQEKGDAFAKELSADGKALYVRVDITDDEAVKAAVQQVVDKYGNLKGCVHCAGIALKRDWTNDAAGSIPNFKKVTALRDSLYIELILDARR